MTEGELADLLEDFNEGRIQFAFVKVKDQNSGLPKNVLIAWCGGGVSPDPSNSSRRRAYIASSSRKRDSMSAPNASNSLGT